MGGLFVVSDEETRLHYLTQEELTKCLEHWGAR